MLTENWTNRGRPSLFGFTLVETVIAVSILGFAALGITTSLVAGTNQNYLSGRYTVAVNLAQSLLDEILAHPFYDSDPNNFNQGPDAGETRATFNNIADFHGLSEPEGSLQDPQGTTLNGLGLSGFSRTVTAEYVYLPGQDNSKPPTFICVTVTVKYKGATMSRLKRLIGATQRPPIP